MDQFKFQWNDDTNASLFHGKCSILSTQFLHLFLLLVSFREISIQVGNNSSIIIILLLNWCSIYIERFPFKIEILNFFFSSTCFALFTITVEFNNYLLFETLDWYQTNNIISFYLVTLKLAQNGKGEKKHFLFTLISIVFFVLENFFFLTFSFRVSVSRKKTNNNFAV